MDYALTVTNFQYIYTGENTTDLPAAAKYAIAKIYERAGAYFISIEGTDRKLYLNRYNGSSWQGWETCVTNSDLPGLKLIQFTLPANSSKTISEKNGRFSQLLFMQGDLGVAFGTYSLSGYGLGGADRYHIGQILTGAGISVSVNNTSFVISNTVDTEVSCSLMIIFGDIPTIS